MNPELLRAAHQFCACYMTGIIWFVQLVHYPMLHHAHGTNAEVGHREYTRRMGFVVMPVMLAELALQVQALLRAPDALAWICGLLLVVVWASTFFLQVPCHRDLQDHYDPDTHRELVRSNWIRTGAWTARAALLMAG